MHVLVLSDIHSRVGNLEAILGRVKNEKIDLVIISGDLTNFGESEDALKVLDALEGFNILAVPGNLDTKSVIDVLEQKNVSIHGKRKKIGNWTIAGFGGGLLRNIGDVKFSEEEIRKSLRENALGKNLILVTHVPPLNSGIDRASNGAFLGSKSVRNIIEERKPRIHICGHVHEAFGETTIGETLSINAGAVKDGRALLLFLEDEVHFRRIDLNE